MVIQELHFLQVLRLYYQKKQKEIVWMLKLRIVYAYVLSDQLAYNFLNKDNHILVGSRFLALPKKSTKSFQIFL